MHSSLVDKLGTEVRRFYNKDFLEAAMAVCALAAAADQEIVQAEHRAVERILTTEPALKDFDAEQATDLVCQFLLTLKTQGDHAKDLLHEKVRGMAGHPGRVRTLMRAAYLIISADGVIREAERQEFQRLCRILELDPREVWHELEG